MVKKILVPLAFSKYSKGILSFAADLAQATGAELLVINIINERDLEAVDKIASFGYKVDVDNFIKTVKEERREEIKKLIGELTLADEKVRYRFGVGEPTEELLKIVISEEVDMVVMGVKNNDIRHIFTGSVAERMFERCPVPVVSYREGEIATRLQKRAKRQLGLDK